MKLPLEVLGTRRHGAWILLVAWWWGAAAAVAAPSAAEIDAAVNDLGSSDFGRRDAAASLLWSAGRQAQPALRRASDSPIPEVSIRAQGLLRKIAAGIGPRTPQDVIDLVANYQDGAGGLKLESARRLIQRGGDAYRPLTRLWIAEKDRSIKTQLTNLLADRATVYAPVLLADGEDEAAERLLKTAAPGTVRGGRDYAAYLLAEGKTPAELRDIARDLPPSAAIWVRLGMGDIAAANQMMPRLADAQMLQTCQWMSGDWPALAKRFDEEARRSRNDALPSLCAAAAFYQMADNQPALDDVLGRLMEHQKRDPSAGFTCAEVFLLSGRVTQGLNILRERSVGTAFDLLCQQFRFDEAFALVDKPANDAIPTELFLSAAKWRFRLGDKPAAHELLQKAAASARAVEPPADWLLGEVIELEIQAGERESAITRALTINDPDGPRSLAPFLFPSRRAYAAVAWRVLRQLHREEPPRATIDRMTRLVEGKFAPDELQAWAVAARRAIDQVSERYERAGYAMAVSRILFLYSQPADAMKVLDLAQDDDVVAEVMLEFGLQLAAKQNWAEAARFFARAQGERSALAPGTYLHGLALSKIGEAAEGERLMKLACKLPLADAAARAALADAMEQAGLPEQAQAQRAVILSLHDFQTYEVSNAARHAGAAAQRRGDADAAADWLARACLSVYLPQTAFREPAAYFILPRAINDARAAADLKAGRADEAWRRITASAQLMPSDADWAIQWVLDLEKVQPQRAQELFGRTWSAMSGVVEKFPNSAGYHNGLAWLGARCGRELESSLAHAKKATALEPENPALLDTLAETHYRRSERDEAAAAMRKCIALDPDSPYYRSQLERFQSPQNLPWQGSPGDR